MDVLHSIIGDQGDEISALQMSLRAVLIFVLGVLIVRFAATRAFGKWSPLDIIFAVIVGSNLSRALTGSAPFVPTLTATVILVALHGLLAMGAARKSSPNGDHEIEGIYSSCRIKRRRQPGHGVDSSRLLSRK